MTSKTSSSGLFNLLLGVGLGFALSKLLGSWRLDGKIERPIQTKDTFFLGVAVNFATSQDKRDFMEIFKPLATYVKSYEQGTCGYKLAESDKEPLRIFILERYIDKEKDFVQAHRSSPAFLEFRAKMAKMQQDKKITAVDGHSYIERSDLGFL